MMEINTFKKQATKRNFQPILETIPSKRQKTIGIQAKPLPVVKPTTSMAKKTAMMNAIKSTSLVTVKASTAPKKMPLTKSFSSGPTVSKFSSTAAKTTTTVAAAKSAAKPAPASKNIAKARPAPYDFKARHALLLEKFNDLKAKNEVQKEQLSNLEELNDAAEQREQELSVKIESIEQELFEANEANAKLKEEIRELKIAAEQLVTKNAALGKSLTDTTEELQTLKTRTIRLEEIALEHEELKRKSGTLESDLEETQAKLLQSQDQLYSINVERMVLHNQVLDLRGNIRVFARVRPPLEAETDKMVCGFSFVDEQCLEIINNEIAPGSRKQGKYDFSFDHVFDPNTEQGDIFDMVSPLIQSALDGYNVCIFAYGEL